MSKSNLIPNVKSLEWTLIYKEKNGQMKIFVSEDKQDVFMELLKLQSDEKIDNQSIKVYKPEGNLTYEQFISA